MKVTTEELERCELLMTVEVEPQQEQKMLQKAAKRIAREVKIPGFRPGKAPYNVIVRRFGVEAVQQEALEQSADQVIQNALKEAEVVPFAQITLESIDWEPLTVKVKVPTPPKVELSEYKDIRLEFEPIEVTDEDVEEAIISMQEETATWNPVERPTEIGDLVTVAIVEKDGDEVLTEHESTEIELDDPTEHEGHDHPDMTTPLLGLNVDEEKSFSLAYSESFGDERYAGKDIDFEVKVLEIKEKEVAPLDDEFAKSVSDFDTLDELKEDTRNKLQEYHEHQQNHELGDKALEQIIEASEIEWPLAYEEESIEEELNRQERQMQAYGLSLDNLLQMQNKSKEDFTEEIREEVINRLKRGLVLGKIAELEELDVSESEILDQAKLIADRSGGGDQLWRNILASEIQRSMIANDLLMNKTLNWLAATAKGEDPTVLKKSEETSIEEADDDDAVPEAAEASAEEEASAVNEDQTDADNESEEETTETEPETQA